MLEVEPWYWSLCDESRWRRRGWIVDPPSVGRATLIEVLESSQQEAQAEAAERDRRRREMQQRTARLARGG